MSCLTGIRARSKWREIVLAQRQHFGLALPCALGGDHLPNRFAEMSMVNQGVVRFAPKAKHGIVFLRLPSMALLFGSRNTLFLAAYQRTYIWVHIYCTEKPDMEWIYGSR